MLENIAKLPNNLGQKMTVNIHTIDTPEQGGKAEERDFLGSLRHSKALMYLGNLESDMHAQSKMCVHKRCETILSFDFGQTPRVSASMAQC